MENSSKKSGGVEIPKRKRSLDLKSLYKSRVSAVEESKKKVPEENDQEKAKKKKKRSRKEVSLSCFESDSKKSRKEDAKDVKSELGFSQKSSGESKGLHGISLALGKNGNAFNFPKRPRGSMGRKKFETDRVSELLELPKPVDDPQKSETDEVSESLALTKSVDEKKLETGKASKPLRLTKSIDRKKLKIGKDPKPLGLIKSVDCKKLETDQGSKPLGLTKSFDSKTGQVPKPSARIKSVDCKKLETGQVSKPLGHTKSADCKELETGQVSKPLGHTKSADCKELETGQVSKLLGHTKSVVRKKSETEKVSKPLGHAKSVEREKLETGQVSKPLQPAKSVGRKKLVTGKVSKPLGVAKSDDRKKLETDQVSKQLELPKCDDHKKLETDQVSKQFGLPKSEEHVGAFNGKVIKSEDEAGPTDQLISLVTLSTGNDDSSHSKSAGKVSGSNSKIIQKANIKSSGKGGSSKEKLKRKARADELMECGNGRLGSVRHADKEDGLALNNGDMSSKKRRSNGKKTKDLVVVRDGGEASKKKSGPSVGKSVSDSLFVDFDEDDDDEENLEQNAARMLSSRFDPSCTGFSSKRKISVSQTGNVPFPVSSSRDSFNPQSNSFSCVDDADDKSRALRPRREDKGKGVTRKRRHFYEVPPADLDPHWFLNRKIKVFWPLDESWYYGLVDDYHPECKLHHIKYDDRDEEWIDLTEEKFKLLLFPSEVPGKAKSKQISRADNDVHKGEAVAPEAHDSHVGNYLDSEPIALWLARSSQRGKSFSKSLKTQKTSHMEPPIVSSMAPEKTDNLHSDVAESRKARSNPDSESTSSNGKVSGSRLGTLYGNHVVYVRKKNSKKGEESGSLSRGIIAYESASETVTPLDPGTVRLTNGKEDAFNWGITGSDKHLWSIDHEGLLRLNFMFAESKKLRFQLCLPVLPYWGFSLGKGNIWLLHNMVMLQHGVMLTTSPTVILEMLFIDSYLGLRFLMFEGCLRQALAFIFLILIVFNQAEDHVNGKMQSPVTSVRFRLSSVDLQKHHVFELHSFSGLQNSKWISLDSKLLQHCLLIKHLPVSECTYNNIKELECGSLKQRQTTLGLELSSYAGFNNKIVPGILPMGVSKEACNTRISQSALSMAAEPGKVPQFALSFSAAPTFFLTLHLQLLMENSFTRGNLRHHDALCSPESSENDRQPDAECAQFELSTVAAQDIISEHQIGTLEGKAPAFGDSASSNENLVVDVALVSNAVQKGDSSENLRRENPEDAGSTGCVKEFEETTPEVMAPSHCCEPNLHEEGVVSFPSPPTSAASPTSNPRSDSRLGGMMVDIPFCDQVDIPLDGKGCISRQASDVGWNESEGFVHSPNPTGSGCWQGHRSISISSPIGDLSPVWRNGSPKFMRSGFSNGPKKPRTQVQYSLPGAGYDFSAKQKMQTQRALPCKRIRRASLKRISDSSRSNQKNFELLACGANILVTHGDKGWRESGALVVLEAADHNEWRLAVKLCGVTKYTYKVKHIFQPGSTNRYSHAMLWKGGKDWVLEFADRSQWILFKEMHEECYNRNIRAASVKNIPIPGVRLVEECDDHAKVPFVRNSTTKYFRQVQTDIEMAMDPSHILYDMDSDDEQWLMANKICSDGNRHEEISEELLEKTMDVLEKFSYVQHRDNFTDAEIQELVIEMGSVEAAKAIYEHWRDKRARKHMPLIRHLQPPLWQRYQQQLKEWERTVAKGNSAVSLGTQEKVPAPEKPPMFAFCLKPRGLDVPNKGSKQRSHRKISVSGHLHPAPGDNDNLLVFGRRSNGHTLGDEKGLYTNTVHESSDLSPSLQASMRVLSPRDSHFLLSADVSESNRNPKVNKNKPRKLALHPSYNNQQTMSYNRRTIANKNGVQLWNMGSPDLPSQRHYYVDGPHGQGVEQLNGSDLHEFQLRDASGAAKHALNMAKLKRERAKRLLYRADLAIHKAVVALMTAEAMKAAHENTNGGN